MNDYSYSSELFLNELLRISSNIIWKNPQKALDSEDSDNAIQVEQFNLASQGQLTFDLIYKFDEEALRSIGLSEIQVIQYSDDPLSIPDDLRDICTEKQIEYILAHFEEKNNYYRMLNGLPDIDDTDYLYNTKYPLLSDSTTPIHLLSLNQLYNLEDKGYLDELRSQYPQKKYLNHLTSKKIDIYTARNIDDYGILWLPESEYETLVDDFKETYSSCRYLITNVYQMQTIKEENSEYTGFIGLAILFMTILQMHKKFLDTDVTRDFYDEDSLKYVYNTYGVPFYLGIPIEYHNKIVKNINRLLSYKGSTQVIYELFDLFEMSAMSIYEYYMLKIHKFENGKPVFIKDENGKYDYRQMFDIKFAQVQLYNNPIEEITNLQNHVDYDNLVETDPYWVTDEELLEKIYSEEYNYMDSKYLGIQTMFNLMKILYESTFYMKMILDNKDTLGHTMIYNNSIRSNCNLFDLIIYTCALICKKYGYEGNIPTDPHQIGKVMGFDFKKNLVDVKDNISNSDYLKNDTKLIEYLNNIDVGSYQSVCNLYGYIVDLKKYLCEKMMETDDKDVYWSYYELYKSLMYSEYTESVFMKSNGEMAESFSDLLSDINPTLYDRLIKSSSDNDEEISYTLYLLKSSCKKLKNIQYLDNANIDTIIEYVFKLIDFFKSAKADTTGYQIVYSLVSQMDNFNKLINYIDIIYDTHEPLYSIIDELKDLIHICNEFQRMKDSYYKLEFKLQSDLHKYKLTSIIEYIDDCIKLISHMIKDIYDSIELDETLSNLEIFLLDGEKFEFGDSVKLLYDEVMEIMKYMIKDSNELQTIIPNISESLKTGNNSLLELVLSVVVLSKLNLSTETYLKDDIMEIMNCLLNEYNELQTILPIISESLNVDVNSVLGLVSSMLIISKLNLFTKEHLKDDIVKLIDIAIVKSNNHAFKDKLLSDIHLHFINRLDIDFKEELSDKLYQDITPDNTEKYDLFDFINVLISKMKLPEQSYTTKDFMKPVLYVFLINFGMVMHDNISKLSENELHISELSQYDVSIMERSNSITKYSKSQIIDTISLKYERTFE